MFITKILNGKTVFIICAMLLGFLMTCEFSITRPALNSIFISMYTTRLIPYSWIACIPLNFFALFLYNHFLLRFGCRKTLLFFIVTTIVINTFAAFFATKIFFFPFFHDLWKNIYILIMLKHLWSMIHCIITPREAKFLYGIIFGMGGIGSVVGGTTAHLLAVPLGSQNLFFFTLPIYCLIYGIYRIALQTGGAKIQIKDFLSEEGEGKETKSIFSLFKESRLLVFVLILVIFMQAAITFIDYQFNISVEAHYQDIDLRTQFLGKIVSIVNSISSTFQFLGGLVLIHFMGIRKLHFMVPIYLLSNTLAYMFFPSFAMISYSYVSIKALDYSVFGIIREFLYLPMKTDEKFRAKAVIDIFFYRGARTIASVLIITLQFATPYFSGILNIITGSIFIFWFLLILQIIKEPAFLKLTESYR